VALHPDGKCPEGGEEREAGAAVKQQGWCGMNHFATLLDVSARTVRRDLDSLRKEGRIIHQPYGGYIADPSGTMLKEKPWIAWS
jgi:DeoR/GlpR family transcriptional regulator of sugar metabolism